LRTNPATKACIWNTNEIQQSIEDATEHELSHAQSYLKEARKRTINYTIVEHMKKHHRAIDIEVVSLRYLELSHSRSMAVLESPVVYWNVEGACSPLIRNFLLIGMDVRNLFYIN
jgi:hypothetical protein